MSLQAKVLSLKLEAVIAARHAEFWQKAIDTHGEEKATAFYTSIGLNHLEAKSFEWEGLTLHREPKEHEKIALKGVANAQENSKEKIATILLELRESLISDGLKAIKKLKPAEFHKLILSVPSESREQLRDRLIKTHKQGRMLVATELGVKDSVPDDDFDELDGLVDTVNSRVLNDVQFRIIDAAARLATSRPVSSDFWNSVQETVNAGSVSYINQTSGGLANRVINVGRGDEIRRRSDDWDRIEYSAILDQNCCSPCAAEDGKEAANESELTPVPNPDCLGMDLCRCFHVVIRDTTA